MEATSSSNPAADGKDCGDKDKSGSLASLGLSQANLRNTSKRYRFSLWLVWQKFKLQREEKRREQQEAAEAEAARQWRAAATEGGGNRYES